jgi:tetratricopeptide (TPR) repeat protein
MIRCPRRILTLLIASCLAGCERGGDTPGPPPTSGVGAGRQDEAVAAAERYLDGNDLAKASAILTTLLEQAPRNPRAHELLGRVRLTEGTRARDRGDQAQARALFADAYDSYRTVAAITPDDAGLQHSAGEVAQAAGLREEALAHYRQAASLEPASVRHLVFAAQVLIETERLDEAASALDRARALDPDEPLVHASLALVALRRRDWPEAIAHIERARSLAPEDVGIRIVEARVHRESGSPRRSVEMLVGLGRTVRSSEALSSELAEAYVALEDHRAAANVWMAFHAEHATEPGAWRAAARVAWRLLDAGERAEAGAWLDRARPSAPDAPEIAALERALAAPG